MIEMAGSLITTGTMVSHLRSRVIDTGAREVLISRLADSGQSGDLTVPANIEGYGRIRHFRQTVANNWPNNPLPIRPACRWLGIPEPEQMEAQIFQLAGCAWRCWYCFVPFNMLSADERRSKWFSANKLVDLYLDQQSRPLILDLTGGSPDLGPEWVGWTMDALEERGATSSVYLWSDDNLSSDRLLHGDGRYLLKRLERYGQGYGKVCCLKGFDPISFSFNTRAERAGFDEQINILEGYAKTQLDLYLYITLTAPPRSEDENLIHSFVRRLADIRSDLPARTVPLRVEEYGPMRARLDAARRDALTHQDNLVRFWNAAVAKEATA